MAAEDIQVGDIIQRDLKERSPEGRVRAAARGWPSSTPALLPFVSEVGLWEVWGSSRFGNKVIRRDAT
jgi:hypothetical protein